jgi:hypothetical protein
MNTEVLERHFAAIGARAKVAAATRRLPRGIDIGTDRKGEFFELRYAGEPGVEVDVVAVDRRVKHLLLLVRDDDGKSKFLCGFDERHWFVAAVPEDAPGVTNVATAKIALQPDLVQASVARIRPKHPFKRRSDAYIRQGEWFFVPAPNVNPPDALVLRNEPLSRDRGKPHLMERAYRKGGELVYVSREYPSGISQRTFDRLSESEKRRSNWRQMRRDAEVYAVGAIRHADHATVRLDGWHRVAMNTEQRARAMRHVAFLD